jgi:hypothetical protein
MFHDHPLIARLALRQLYRHSTTPEQQNVFGLAILQSGDHLVQIGQTLDDATQTSPSSPTAGPIVTLIQLLIANLPTVMQAVETLLSLLGVIKEPVPTPTPTPAPTPAPVS